MADERPDVEVDRDRVVLDPLYGYVTIPGELQPLVDHPLVQRLRRVAQTSLAATVYPALTSTRFEHALGAMHLAMRAWDAAWNNSRALVRSSFAGAVADTGLGITEQDASTMLPLAVGGVALLHDVGHPPFSHALEGLFALYGDVILSDDGVRSDLQMWSGSFHEFAGHYLVTKLVDCLRSVPLGRLIDHVYQADPQQSDWAGTARSLISGEVDVDRIDYLIRDAYHAGTEYGSVDWERILDSLEIQPDRGGYRLAPGYRARSGAEHLLVQRSQSFRWVYLHPRVVAADLFLSRAGELLFELCESDEEIDSAAFPTVGAAFTALRPNLDYLAPKPQIVYDRFGVTRPPASEQLALEFRSFGADDERIRLQAGVDDHCVWQWLSESTQLARALLQARAVRRSLPTLTRFVRYSDEVLHRAKDFVAAWKNYEEYHSVAKELRTSSLEGIVAERFADLINYYGGERSENGAKLQAWQFQLQARFYGTNPIVWWNQFLRFMFVSGTDSLRELLSDQFDSPFPDVRGFWDVTFRTFQSLAGSGQMAGLFKDEKFNSLVDTSPLVRALHEVDRERMRLFVYYFPTNYNEGAALPTTERRKYLQEEFIRAFPGYVAAHLQEILIAHLARGTRTLEE